MEAIMPAEAGSAAGCWTEMLHSPAPECCNSTDQTTSADGSSSDMDWLAWPVFDDLPEPQQPFGWALGAAGGEPQGVPPPDDLDLDGFLAGLDEVDGCGVGLAAEQPMGSFGEPLGSIDSLVPSDFRFDLQEGDTSPLYSEPDCMTSPPCFAGALAEGPVPEAQLKPRKAKATRERKVRQVQPTAIRRPRGRPRVYDTSIPEKGRDSTGESDSCSVEAPKKRGAKPKYKASSEAEAVAMRRERNRNTAISSYYKKKERNEQLLHMIQCLEQERDALQQLECLVESPMEGLDVGLIGQTLRQTCSGQQTLIHLQGEQPSVVAENHME